MRRQFQGGRLAPRPAYLHPRPPPAHGPSRKTPGAPRTEGDQTHPSNGGISANAKPKSSSAAARLKAAIRVSALLSSGAKTSGQPPAIHPPWNKARVRPVEEVEGSREERKVEGAGRGLERGEEGRRENNRGGRDERTERREMETWGRSNRGGGMDNGMRNAVQTGEGVRPEHRGALPGLSSTDHFSSHSGGMVIDGSYFQTSVEASKPPPVRQKLSEALSLISLARRLQGPARVGDEQWSDGHSWGRGEGNSRKMYGSVGDMSVSASVSEERTRSRRWERELGEENRSSEVWWKTEQRFNNSDSETGSGSKESRSEFSSSSSSATAETDKTESDTETEKSNSGTEKEDTDSERESGLESDGDAKESRKRSKGSSSSESSNSVSRKSRSSSARVTRERSSHSTNSKDTDPNSSRDSGSLRTSSSRPQTSKRSRSSHETIEEESEEDEESEGEVEGGSVGTRKSLGSKRVQPDDTSDDLSPIIEDTEEEEEEEEEGSSGHGGDGGKDEEDGDLDDESAD